MDKQNIHIIIPALIKDVEKGNDVELLGKTLESILENVDSKIFIILQGNPASRQYLNDKFKKFENITILYSDRALGKWGAVRMSVSFLKDTLDYKNDIFLLMDSDYSFTGKDINNLVQPIVTGNSHYVIGDRDRIILPTKGSKKDDRVYVEVYFNALSMIILEKYIKDLNPIDIQCGFQAFDSKVFRKLNFNKIPRNYGGEMEIFYQNVINGYEPASRKVKLNEISMASFNLENVIQGLLQLDIYKNVSENQKVKAIELGADVYEHRIKDPSDYNSFVKDIIKKIP